MSRLTSGRIEPRAVGSIAGEFYVPAYQRGYRWGANEVRALLDDVWAHGEQSAVEVYCLQPVVVAPRGGSAAWELVDGQQRLTTLFILERFLAESGYGSGPQYSITYETRERSAAFLARISRGSLDRSNIDFAHMSDAFETIEAWFRARAEEGPDEREVARRFVASISTRVAVIWYEAPAHEKPVELFTRLNANRIPLTDAELVKALLLERGAADPLEHPGQVAEQWDLIERELGEESLWGFITAAVPSRYATRIDLLLAMYVGDEGERRTPHRIFNAVFKRIQARSRKEVWGDIVSLYARIREWYEDRDLFHKVGFLVAEEKADGKAPTSVLEALLARAQVVTRERFSAELDERIRATLGLTAAELQDLDYRRGWEKSRRALFLMNVVTTLRRTSDGRYPFHLHRAMEWSLEHIHAQHAEPPRKKAEWQSWLDAHRKAIEALPDASTCHASLLAEIDAARDAIDRDTFAALSPRILGVLSPPGDDVSTLSVDSISNLALLSSNVNSGLSNYAFAAKRALIIRYDDEGRFIPICTQRVFFKYYSKDDAPQFHFWDPGDRGRYLAAIVSTLKDYLKPEVSP